MTLAWNPSPHPTVKGYNIYYWNSSAATSNILFAAGMFSVGAVTNATVTNLVAGTTYTFAATTVDASGVESLLSSEVIYKIPTNAVVIAPGNCPPTLNALGGLTINSNVAPQTVNLTGITSGASNEVQTLTVTATSSNTNLIGNPTINYTSPNTNGTLSFTPVFSRCGTATITVTVNDGGASNNLASRSFLVTVGRATVSHRAGSQHPSPAVHADCDRPGRPHLRHPGDARLQDLDRHRHPDGGSERLVGFCRHEHGEFFEALLSHTRMTANETVRPIVSGGRAMAGRSTPLP